MGEESLDPVLAGAVVVGVEQSAEARAALEYALAEGRRRELPVHVVTVYQPTEQWLWGFAATGAAPPGEEPAVDLAAVQQGVAELVDGVRGSLFGELGVGFPPVELHTVLGRPSEVLVESTTHAAVLVVGHPGRGMIRGALLGSVALSCAANARCPVTVVPPPPSPEGT